MKMRKAIWLQVLLLLLLGTALLMISGCPMDPVAEAPGVVPPVGNPPGTEQPGGAGGSTAIPPPEYLLGTFALNNGTSAVMEIQIGSAQNNYVAGFTPRATTPVTGNVRYEGDDYIAGGLYDDDDGSLNLFAKNETEEDPEYGWKFIFIGTYTPASGFSGNVTLYDGPDTGTAEVVTTGSASAAEANNDDVDTIKIFIGTFGGDAWGTWNGTLTADQFYGTYAGITGDGEDLDGSFTMDRTDVTLHNLYGSTHPTEGGGTLYTSGGDGNWTISGWWRVDVDISGVWSGHEVDENNDPHEPNADDDSPFLANLMKQAIENGISLYDGALHEGDISLGNFYEHICAYDVDFDEDGTPDGRSYEFGEDGTPYEDIQTELELDGFVYLASEVDPVTEEPISMVIIIDSDISDSSWDNGLKIGFPDTSAGNAYLYTAVFVDYNDESFSELNSGDSNWDEPVWVLSDDTTYGDDDDADVINDMESILF